MPFLACSVHSAKLASISLHPCKGMLFSEWADFGKRYLSIGFHDEVYTACRAASAGELRCSQLTERLGQGAALTGSVTCHCLNMAD